MERWNENTDEFVTDTPKIDSFISEIEIVCIRHGFSISHEDGHGSFIIEKYDEDNIKRLESAAIGETLSKSDSQCSNLTILSNNP
jgi:hypothetical protein